MRQAILSALILHGPPSCPSQLCHEGVSGTEREFFSLRLIFPTHISVPEQLLFYFNSLAYNIHYEKLD